MAAAGTLRLGRLCVVLCWFLTVTLTSAVEQLTAGKLLKFESYTRETNKNKLVFKGLANTLSLKNLFN